MIEMSLQPSAKAVLIVATVCLIWKASEVEPTWTNIQQNANLQGEMNKGEYLMRCSVCGSKFSFPDKFVKPSGRRRRRLISFA